MMFIDAEIYAEYAGEAIPGDEFARYAARACEAVDAATGWKLTQMWDGGELPGFVRKQVELACCAQAEYLYINGADTALDGVSGAGYMICSIQAFLRHLKTTQYARLFENAEAMRQMLETDRFPLGLVGEALEMALERHRRYPLFDGANYALQLLTDWSSRGITTPQQLQESRDNYSDC